MSHFAGHCQLILQGQFNALEHHIPIDPLKHHLTPVIQVTVSEQAEGSQSRERKLAGQRFVFVIEVDEKRFFVTRADKAGGVAVKGRLGFLAFGIEVPWSAALLLQSFLAFGVAVQFSPGFFGQFEAICRATLALYAVGTGPAVSFAFGFHLGGFVPITLLGLWSLSRAHLHLADLNMRDENAGD